MVSLSYLKKQTLLKTKPLQFSGFLMFPLGLLGKFKSEDNGLTNMDICTRELPSLENDREVFAKQHSHDNEGLKKNKFVVSIYNQCRPHMNQMGHTEATGNQSVGWKNHIAPFETTNR